MNIFQVIEISNLSINFNFLLKRNISVWLRVGTLLSIVNKNLNPTATERYKIFNVFNHLNFEFVFIMQLINESNLQQKRFIKFASSHKIYFLITLDFIWHQKHINKNKCALKNCLAERKPS